MHKTPPKYVHLILVNNQVVYGELAYQSNVSYGYAQQLYIESRRISTEMMRGKKLPLAQRMNALFYTGGIFYNKRNAQSVTMLALHAKEL